MNKVVSDYKKHKFICGKYDCCMFAADIVKAKTGKDLAEKYRGTYTTELGAAKALKKYGTMTETLDANFDRLDDINFAKRGDIVTFVGGHGVGVVWSGGILGMNVEHGLVKTDDEVKTIWRIISD